MRGGRVKNVVEPQTPHPQEVLLRLNVSGRTAKQETSTQDLQTQQTPPPSD